MEESRRKNSVNCSPSIVALMVRVASASEPSTVNGHELHGHAMLKSNARLSLIFLGHGSRAPDRISCRFFPSFCPPS